MEFVLASLRKEQEFLVRGFGGGSLMTWAAISSFGRLALVFVERRMNLNAYLVMLEANLIPFLRKYRRPRLISLQAVVHR